MYLLVPYCFRLQALKIDLSRPGGVEEGSAEDSSEGLKYLCVREVLEVSAQRRPAQDQQLPGDVT